MAQIQICRTCLEVIRKPSMFVTLDGSNAKSKEIKSKLEACIPEMTINTVKSPVICGRCLISLNASFEFRRKCIASEEEIYNYLFDSEVEVVDLQSIASQPSVDSYCVIKAIKKENVKQEIQSVVCKAEDDEICFKAEKKEVYENVIFSTVKEETMDCDFEATDTMLCLDDSEEFSNISPLIPFAPEDEMCLDDSEEFSNIPPLIPFAPEDEKTSTEQSRNRTTPLPDCSVVLTRLSDDLLNTNIDTEPNLSGQIRHFKKSPKTTKRNVLHKKYADLSNECFVCYPYNSKTVEPMKVHKRMKVSEDEKRFRCGMCGYNSKMKINIHMRMHTGEKPHKCSVCGFATAYSNHLKTHMKIHSKNKCHRCAYCQFGADSEMGLNNHMKIHPGFKMYKCNECEYSTDILKCLKYHELVHTNKQIYECATCAFTTCVKNMLAGHVKTHLIKSCDKCPFSTMNYAYLNKHLKSHDT